MAAANFSEKYIKGANMNRGGNRGNRLAIIRSVRSSASAWVIGASLAGLVSTSPASAQTTPDAVDPAARYAFIGAGNVQMKDFAFRYSHTDLSVGPDRFPSRLELVRYWTNSGPGSMETSLGNFGHNFDVSINCYNYGSNYDICDSGIWNVKIGSESFFFNRVTVGADALHPDTFRSSYPDGAQLILTAANKTADQKFIFRTAQGDEIEFPRSELFYNYRGNTHLASVWRVANGESIAFTYEVALNKKYGWNNSRRLRKVVNSRGYGFKFNYKYIGGKDPETNMTLNNWGALTISSVDAIAPGCVVGTTVSCDTGAVATASYGYTQVGTASAVYNVWKMSSFTDTDNNTFNYTWTTDPYRLLISESNPAESGTFNFQNTWIGGRVDHQVDPLLKTWTYSRTVDSSGITAQVENPLHEITRYHFPPSGMAPDWVEDPALRRTIFAVDGQGRTGAITTPSGMTTTYSYDARGNLTNTTITPSTSVASAQGQIQTSSHFPSCDESNWKICNKPDVITDSRSGQTQLKYDAGHGGVVAVLGPAVAAGRPLTKYSYDVFAPSTAALTPYASIPNMYLPTKTEVCLSSNGTTNYDCPASDSIVTSYVRDPSPAEAPSQSLVNSVVADPNGFASTTTLKYTVRGDIDSADGPRTDADLTTFGYNGKRQLSSVTEPDPDGSGAQLAPKTTYGHDANGRPTNVLRVAASGSFGSGVTYDAAGRAIVTSDSRTGSVNQSYDDAGRPYESTQTVSGTARVTRQVYDSSGRLMEIRSAVNTDLEQATVKYQYNLSGSPISMTDANGNKTSFCYDGYERLVETRFPSTGTLGAPGTSGTPGTSVDCSVTVAGGLGVGADYAANTLDAAGNVISQRLRDGRAISISYDGLNRAQSKDVPDADRDVTYNYDLAGRLKSANLPGTNASLSVSWNYDKLGRVTSTTSAGRQLSYGYSSDGTSATLTWPDLQSVQYYSDTAGRASSIWGLPEGGTRPLIAALNYDQLSRRTSIVRGSGVAATTTDYTNQFLPRQIIHSPLSGSVVWFRLSYNEAGQIKNRTTGPNNYVWQGSDVTRTYQPNGLNQYGAFGALTLTYDARGNLASDGISTYVYDGENRMTSASTPSGSSSLNYDALGRLANIVVGGNRTSFLYDGTDIVGEYDGSGNLLRRYVHGPGTDDPLAWYEGSTTSDLRWLYADERGSIVAAVNRGGAVLATSAYDEFGALSGTGLGRFRYTGQAWLPELGLYYYKARMYSASLGRFMQPDPIGYEGGINLYAYVDNDPLSSSDPSGLVPGDFNDPYRLPPLPYYSVYSQPNPGGGGGWAGFGFLNSINNFNPGGRDALAAILRNRQAGIAAATQLPCQNKSQLVSLTEAAFQGLGYLGDGAQALGAYTGFAPLAVVGTVVEYSGLAGSATLHWWTGDNAGLIEDGIGFGAGLIPGGKIARKFGGAAFDWGRRSNGQFRRGMGRLRETQNAVFGSSQKALVSGGSVCPVKSG